jgi:hypothetical protein
MTTAERSCPAGWRPLHDDESRSLQMLDQALGDDRRHEFVGVVNALAALKAQGEGERVGQVLEFCQR